jgi:2-C-methyl-D-erythritol 4-phosphate cytidylyltransferase
MSEPLPRTIEESIVAVIPAAGIGTRFGARLPKQYLELEGQTVLQRSIDAMLAVPRVSAVVVAVASEDPYFSELPAALDARVQTVPGGSSRAESVAAGVAAVRAQRGDSVWVLVHDAARPLVARSDVDRLLDRVLDGRDGAHCGGILAAAVTDTIKRASIEGLITATVAREHLWRAQTPQLFRAGELGDALDSALDAERNARVEPGTTVITDEASAMERAGHACVLVGSEHPNPKITHPDDLAVASALLSSQGLETHHAHR